VRFNRVGAFALSRTPRRFDIGLTVDDDGEAMKYALLLYQDKAFEEEWDATGPDQRAEIYAQFAAFDEAVAEAGGKILGGNELGLSHAATTVRRAGPNRSGDEFTVTEGPFTELDEHLGGYFEIEARHLDHAIEIAKLLPHDATEIRPIIEPEER
jgi:hypothetical protein